MLFSISALAVILTFSQYPAEVVVEGKDIFEWNISRARNINTNRFFLLYIIIFFLTDRFQIHAGLKLGNKLFLEKIVSSKRLPTQRRQRQAESPNGVDKKKHIHKEK